MLKYPGFFFLFHLIAVLTVDTFASVFKNIIYLAVEKLNSENINFGPHNTFESIWKVPDPGGPKSSVADPDPGSGAFSTPGSGIGFFRIPDLGSRIPNPYF